MASNQVCESCGATIYPEHIEQGRAARWAGQLLCPPCYTEKRSAVQGVGERTETGPGPVVIEVEPVAVDPDEPISLVESSESRQRSRIHGISQQSAQIVAARTEWKRSPAVTGKGACRVKTFHSKIQIESIDFMDNAINEWLDENPEVEVKFVTSTIGTMAGKHPEPNLILNIWY